jgi:hypothetical protein
MRTVDRSLLPALMPVVGVQETADYVHCAPVFRAHTQNTRTNVGVNP